jgi:hypothetical protein
MKPTINDIEKIALFYNSQGMKDRRIAIDLTPEELGKLMSYRNFGGDWPKEYSFLGHTVYSRKSNAR